MREATPADASVLHALLEILGRPRADPPSPAQGDGLAACMTDPACRLLVAERAGRTVGMAAVWFRARLNHDTPEAWIADLVVHPDARRRGVGAALVAAARAEAEARDCHMLRLESGHARTASHRMYEGLGFVDAGISFQLRLRPGPGRSP